jgi:hypothetical protein
MGSILRLELRSLRILKQNSSRRQYNILAVVMKNKMQKKRGLCPAIKTNLGVCGKQAQLAAQTPETTAKRLSWHSAFVEAMRRELKPWENSLSFEAEHLLNAAPLALDLLIIKKDPALIINNRIAAIFKSHNIIEYKSPRAYVSVFDFNKVCGYAYIYSALRKTPLEDITVTLIEDHYPRKLFAYLNRLGCSIEETWGGIYRIRYAKMPLPAMQLIERKRLSANDNLWLKSLGDSLGVAELKRLLKESRKGAASVVKGAYMDLLLTVNRETVKEMAMRKIVTWEEIFKETGQIEEWEERVKAQVEERVTAKVEKRVTAQVEKRTAAEREQLRQEIERLRQENERLRVGLAHSV